MCGRVVFNTNITSYIIYAFINHTILVVGAIVLVVLIVVASKLLLAKPKGRRAKVKGEK